AALGRISVLAAGVGWSWPSADSAPSGSPAGDGSTGPTAAGGDSTTVGNRTSEAPGRLDTAMGGGDAVSSSWSGMTIAAAVGVGRSDAGVTGGGGSRDVRSATSASAPVWLASEAAVADQDTAAASWAGTAA